LFFPYSLPLIVQKYRRTGRAAKNKVALFLKLTGILYVLQKWLPWQLNVLYEVGSLGFPASHRKTKNRKPFAFFSSLR